MKHDAVQSRCWPACIAAVLLAGVMLSAGGAAAAAELFRYVNEDGVVVITSTLPPRHATRGYTVIDSRGRVIREVPRQLNPEEIEARQREEAIREAERAEAERQRLHDEELLRLYSSPEDVARARDRRLESVATSIIATQSSIQRLEARKRDLSAQAAEHERAGRRVPEQMLEDLQTIERRLESQQDEIREREREKERIRESFDSDRARLARMLGVEDT